MRLPSTGRADKLEAREGISSGGPHRADSNRMQPFRQAWKMTVLVVAAMLATGCSSSWNPFAFEGPPGGRAASLTGKTSPKQTVVVIGEFENPGNSVTGWRDIGSGVSEAIAKTLVNDARFDVRVDAKFAREVQALVNRAPNALVEQLGEIRRRAGHVDFVLLGKVTDFHHTGELGREASRWGLFGPKNEAVVAVDVTIIDLATARLASSDQIVGTAGASKTPPDETYRDMSFGSYLFWETPLGIATKRAVEASAERLAEVAPRTVAEMRIARLVGLREVEVLAGSDHGLQQGQMFHVCVQDETTGAMVAVRDPQTNLPLEARVTKVNRTSARAWLVGQPPVSTDFRRAVLRRDAPRERVATQPVDQKK